MTEMDIELTPEELSASKIQQIATHTAEGNGIDSGAALALLRHILWLEDEREKTRVRLDPYLDQAHGSPAVSLH
jgi:hypothetical protein